MKFSELVNKRNEIHNELKNRGLDDNTILTIVDCMYTADAYGVCSHGLNTAEAHIKRIDSGSYNLKPSFKVLKKSPSFSIIDGDNAIGFVSAKHCLDYCCNEARKKGLYTVFSRNNNTFGPAFYYSLLAARRGLIAFICSNSPAQMALTNGCEKLLGTNPFSMVIPVPQHDPIIIDMASSVVAKSKFKILKTEGLKLPDGWALDKNGLPTNDPDKGIQGFVLPMAGIKGTAIALMIDLVSGLLSGSNYLNLVNRFYDEKSACMGVGYFITVIDPNFVTDGRYDSDVIKFYDKLVNSKTVKGKKIIIPGDDRNKFFKEISYEK